MIFLKRTLPTIAFSLLLTVTGCAVGNQNSATTLVSSCSLDSIAGGAHTPPTSYSISLSPPDIIFSGWLANNLAGVSPDDVMIVIADSKGQIYASKSGKPKSRPDVASAYKKPGMENSGFEILMENLKASGIYTVTMQGSFSGDTMICSRSYTLNVTD